ncbi:hypothetical protein Tco_0140162 [Tanacetum coccineum]
MPTPNNNNNNSQMHNDIMAACLKDRPPMLATGRYAQWQSRFIRYVDTKPAIKELKKCIFNGPYVMTRVLVPAKPTTKIDPAVPEHTIKETYENTLPENRAYIDAEAKAIHMILIGIGDEIYSTVDACKTSQEILLQEMGSQLNHTTQEWSRFVTVVKRTVDLDKESYHKLFDILKQYQNEVNEIRAEKIVNNTNSLALVAAAQQTKGKEVAKPRTPRSLSASKDDSDLEQAQRDKDMQKSISLITKYFTKIYKPTNNNLRTSSNSRNKNVDSTLRIGNAKQTGQFGNQRTEYGYFAKEFRKPKRVKDYSYHKEKMMLCKQEEKAHYMYMAKIQEVLHVIDDNSGPIYDTEPLKQVQTNNEYNVFAKGIQHSEQSETINDTYVMETIYCNVIPDHSVMYVGIKSLLNAISITAALIDVNAAQSKLVLQENFNENYSKCLRLLYKVNVAEGVNVASEEVRISQKLQENNQKRASGHENLKSTKSSQRIKDEARKVKPQPNHGQ